MENVKPYLPTATDVLSLLKSSYVADGNFTSDEFPDSNLENIVTNTGSNEMTKYTKQWLSPTYIALLSQYDGRRLDGKFDFTDRVPGKNVQVLSPVMMPGAYGFTYLGDNFMALRDNLIGDFKTEVDVHESIHTPDEYETHRITHWIISKERPKYIH